MTLLLRCVSAGIELRCNLGHAYIISNTLYTGSGCWFHLGSAYLHIIYSTADRKLPIVQVKKKKRMSPRRAMGPKIALKRKTLDWLIGQELI